MNINVTISAAPDLLQTLQTFVGLLTGKTSTDKKDKPVKPVVTTPATATEAAEPDKVVTLTQIRELATDLSQSHGKGPAVKNLLKQYDCDTLTKLPQEQYNAFFNELKGL